MRLDLRINGNKTEIKSAADQMEALSAVFLPCVGKLADTVCRTDVYADGVADSNISFIM